MVDVASSINGVPIRLTGERWQHITDRHREMEGKQKEVMAMVSSPDTVQEGDFGACIAVKERGGYFFVVVYREIGANDGFIVTAYIAEQLRRRRGIWKR